MNNYGWYRRNPNINILNFGGKEYEKNKIIEFVNGYPTNSINVGRMR